MPRVVLTIPLHCHVDAAERVGLPLGHRLERESQLIRHHSPVVLE